MESGGVPLIGAVQGCVVWVLTWCIGRYMPAGKVREKARHFLPEVALVLSVFLAGMWNHLQGSGALTLDTVQMALVAGGVAIGGHSAAREKVKLLAKSRQAGEHDAPAQAPDQSTDQ